MAKTKKEIKKTNKPPSRKGSPNDFQTPTSAVDVLLPYLPKNKTIWQCAKGKGNIVKYLKKHKYNVIGTDILDGSKYDFLTMNVPKGTDIIVTNPPYDIKNDFLKRAFELKKPFAFLLPLTTLESKARQDLFSKYGVKIILFPKRVNFETPSGEGGGSWFATAWFCYGLNIQNQLTFSK